jgi:hypothetical protein
MKKLLFPSILVIASLSLMGCSTASSVDDGSTSPTPSATESANGTPSQPSEVTTPSVVEVSLKPGEQYRFEGSITREEAQNLVAAASNNGVIAFVASEDASYDPFLVALGTGETVVYLSVQGDASPKYTFRVSVNATPAEVKTLEQARELSETVAGLSLEDAKVQIEASGNSAISYEVYDLTKDFAESTDYDLGRINLYINASGSVEYAGVG